MPTAAARKVAGDVVPKDVSAASEEEAAPLAYEDAESERPMMKTASIKRGSSGKATNQCERA